MPDYTPYHSQYFANRITLTGVDEDAFAKALTTDSLERGIEPGRSRSSVGPGPGLAVDVDAMVSVRQFVLVVAVRQKSVLRRFLQHHLRRRISGMYHCNVTFLFMFWSGIE